MRHILPGPSFSARLYRSLLRCYPAPFRQEYGTEMALFFQERLRDEHRFAGMAGVAALWFHVLPDLIWQAGKEHFYMLLHDLRYALRSLRHSPGFTTVAVFCLALGIGASTAIFSIVNTVMLRELPFRDSARLMRIYTEFPTFPGGGLPKFAASAPEFREIQREQRAWDQVEAWAVGGASLNGSAEPVRISACFVSGALLQMLGAGTQRGRLIGPSDDVEGAPLTIVLSDGLWKRAFGADTQIIGKETYFDGAKATVVGVAPASFEFPPGASEPAEAWVPIQLTAQQMTRRGGHFLSLIAHRRPGLTMEQARAELSSLVTRFGERASRNFHTINPKNHPFVLFGFQEEVTANVRKAMLMLLGAVGFFLLIACVNVANLLLARSDARQREIAVRKAIGASTPDLIRQFVVEGILLSTTGALLGLALAWAGVRLIVATNAGTIPRIREAGLNGQVLGFAFVVALVTGIVFGLAPVVQIVTRPLQESLKAAAGRASASLRSNRFRAALVASELALALMLLIGSGLLVRAFWMLQQVDLGIRPEALLTMRLSLTSNSYRDNTRLRQFWASVDERLQILPGVRSATIARGLPPERQADQNDTEIENFVPHPGGPAQNVAFYQPVGDHFFETLGMRLVDGRFLSARDGANAPLTAVVNQTMARSFWPGQSAIGKRIRPSRAVDRGEWTTIVGVVADVKNAGLNQPVGTEVFLPAAQGSNAAQAPYVIVRAAGDPRALANAVRQVIRDVDPSVPVSQVRTMDEVLSQVQSRPRFLAMVLTLFSSLALALAAFGVYGVVSYSVSQRTAEFGIRMALGAQRRDVLRLVLREGIVMTGVGVLIGAVGALLLGRFMQDLLFGISHVDGGTFAAMTLVLGAVTLVACWIPARRATGVDPMLALRYE